MDNVMWVVIAAAVAIALAGILLYVGGDSLGDFSDNANETSTGTICDFEASEVEADRLSCDDISSECEGEIEACS